MNTVLKLITIIITTICFFSCWQVNADDLPANEPRFKTVDMPSDDADLTRQVGERVQNTISSGTNIGISVQDGTVYLSGNLKTQQEANDAISAANSVSGVRGVKTDNLIVNSNPEPDKDAIITSQVKGIFQRENLFAKTMSAQGISVEVKDGVVYLTGAPDTQGVMPTAAGLAQSIDGVKSVQTSIRK
jgi:hyperosmotically inducible protein